MNLQYPVSIVLDSAEPICLIFAFLDVVEFFVGFAKLHIPIKACVLQFLNFVLSLTHNVRNTWRGTRITRPIGDIQVFCRDKHRHLTIHRRVKINLLKRGTRQRQRPQHFFVFRTEFLHLFRQLVIHVIYNTGGSFLGLPIIFANNFSPNGSLCRKRLCNHF